MKWIGWVIGGVGLVAAAGGLYWYLKRRQEQGESPSAGPRPSNPPRAPSSPPIAPRPYASRPKWAAP